MGGRSGDERRQKKIKPPAFITKPLGPKKKGMAGGGIKKPLDRPEAFFILIPQKESGKL